MSSPRIFLNEKDAKEYGEQLSMYWGMELLKPNINKNIEIEQSM